MSGQRFCDAHLHVDCGSCERFALGTLLQALHEDNLWPLPEADQVEVAPIRLMRQFEELKTAQNPMHTTCQIIDDIRVEMRLATSATYATSTESQRKHMKTRTEETGIDWNS